MLFYGSYMSSVGLKWRYLFFCIFYFALTLCPNVFLYGKKLFELGWRLNKGSNIHPNLGQEITRQPLYLNANICNKQNIMWREEANNKL